LRDKVRKMKWSGVEWDRRRWIQRERKTIEGEVGMKSVKREGRN
jgi:hypothetical protein